MAERVEQEQINRWYKTEVLEHDVVAINEPYHGEDNFFYLVRGTERDLLIDTGMGIVPTTDTLMSIRSGSRELVVVNTHWHFDHIGGNREFEEVLVPPSEHEVGGIEKGWTHEMLQRYGFEQEFIDKKWPNGFDPKTYEIEGYQRVRPVLENGHIINLGNRQISVVNTPGHTPGSISFFERESGILFSSDLVYNGPLYCFEGESSVEQYVESLMKIKMLKPSVVYAGHNQAVNSPRLIDDALYLLLRSQTETPDSSEHFNELQTSVFKYDTRQLSRLRVIIGS